MSKQQTSPTDGQLRLTQHAMLVLWGAYAQQIGLVESGSKQVKLSQKKRDA